jgi:hypothetical protein
MTTGLFTHTKRYRAGSKTRFSQLRKLFPAARRSAEYDCHGYAGKRNETTEQTQCFAGEPRVGRIINKSINIIDAPKCDSPVIFAAQFK